MGEVMERPLTQNIRPGEPPLDVAGYVQAGGYRAVRKALHELAPQQVAQMVKEANLPAANASNASIAGSR